MAYDEQLANRIRQAFGARKDITERKMFGGLAFLYRGRMCYGIVERDSMVRVPDDEYDNVVRRRHVRPMDFTGEPLRGFVDVSPPGFRTSSRSPRGGCRAANGSPRRRRRHPRSPPSPTPLPFAERAVSHVFMLQEKARTFASTWPRPLTSPRARSLRG